MPKDIFDFENPYIRKITLSQLDLIVYNQEDWFRFRQQIRDLDRRHSFVRPFFPPLIQFIH